jgi:hypothetical protein
MHGQAHPGSIGKTFPIIKTIFSRKKMYSHHKATKNPAQAVVKRLASFHVLIERQFLVTMCV